MSLKKELDNLADYLKVKLQEKLRAKGHVFEGNLMESIDVYSKEIANGLYIFGEFLDYGASQDQGIKPDRIPYNEGSGAKTSLYIEGLTRWVQKKLFISEIKQAKGIAFAIARTHKKVGMHSLNKKANPDAAGWMSETLQEQAIYIQDVISNGMEREIDFLIDNFLTKAIVIMK